MSKLHLLSGMLKILFFFFVVVSLTSCHQEDGDIIPVDLITGLDISLDSLKNIGLPLLVIETEGHEEPSCTYVGHPEGCFGGSITNATKVPGRLIIYMGGANLYDSGLYCKGDSGITIKIRGNGSAQNNKDNGKKPYNIKLQKKEDLLFRGNDVYKDKNWLLIKEQALRPVAGFLVNELVGLQWTPRYRFVNVILNNNYKGVYMLLEAVNRSKGRLDVDKDGFIFEFDAYFWNEKVFIQSPHELYLSINYTFKYPDPDDISEEKVAELKAIIDLFEDSLIDGTYSSYIDVKSFAAWLLAQDILGSGDPGGSNMFLTKKNKDSKIMMGNLWDLDGIMWPADGYWGLQHCYGMFCYSYLLNSANREFIEEYKRIWNEIKGSVFTDIEVFLNNFSNSKEAKALNDSYQLDKKRWGYERNSVYDDVESIKMWLKKQEVFMSNNVELM